MVAAPSEAFVHAVLAVHHQHVARAQALQHAHLDAH